jgi:hypothetical protein
MDQVLKSLVVTGKVDITEAKLYATNLDLFADHISRAG